MNLTELVFILRLLDTEVFQQLVRKQSERMKWYVWWTIEDDFYMRVEIERNTLCLMIYFMSKSKIL